MFEAVNGLLDRIQIVYRVPRHTGTIQRSRWPLSMQVLRDHLHPRKFRMTPARTPRAVEWMSTWYLSDGLTIYFHHGRPVYCRTEDGLFRLHEVQTRAEDWCKLPVIDKAG